MSEHQDPLGSTVAATNDNRNVYARVCYAPFGLAMDDKVQLRDGAGFTGHIKDTDTGLNYMQARYYDPVMGRFLIVDPMDFMSTGSPDYFNRYAYTWNDPIIGIDPNGEAVKLVKSVYNVGKRTYKNGGNLKGALKDEVLSYVENGATLLDGQLNINDVFAVFDLATGFGDELKATQKAADSALKSVGKGKGAVHGTKVHTQFAKELNGKKNISTKISYKGGEKVTYGTKGSIRVDAVIGGINNPSGVVDLKTGGAKPSESRATKFKVIYLKIVMFSVQNQISYE